MMFVIFYYCMKKINQLKKELSDLSNVERAITSQRFFKTEPGQYGAGDVFLGISVPDQRSIAKKYRMLSLEDLSVLFASKEHEFRLTSVFILVDQFKSASKHPSQQTKIVDFYLSHLDYINNWDIVDSSAHQILGQWLLDNPSKKNILTQLSKSGDLWRERVSIVATYALIKNGNYSEIFAIAQYFLSHQHDLIHKATGWMLREVGKKDENELISFLDLHYHQMPRTMLRYSIERLDTKKRAHYLA